MTRSYVEYIVYGTLGSNWVRRSTLTSWAKHPGRAAWIIKGAGQKTPQFCASNTAQLSSRIRGHHLSQTRKYSFPSERQLLYIHSFKHSHLSIISPMKVLDAGNSYIQSENIRRVLKPFHLVIETHWIDQDTAPALRAKLMIDTFGVEAEVFEFIPSTEPCYIWAKNIDVENTISSADWAVAVRNSTRRYC